MSNFNDFPDYFIKRQIVGEAQAREGWQRLSFLSFLKSHLKSENGMTKRYERTARPFSAYRKSLLQTKRGAEKGHAQII